MRHHRWKGIRGAVWSLTLLLGGAALMLMTGCLPKHAFAPPPDNWEVWSRPGADQLAIFKDLLNCGYGSPVSGSRIEPDPNRTLNDVAGSMICMERLGYIHAPRGRAKPICRTSGWKAREACVSGEGVPTPDPQRRVNSPYCRKYTTAPACVL